MGGVAWAATGGRASLFDVKPVLQSPLPDIRTTKL
jgi:hypothetical protein